MNNIISTRIYVRMEIMHTMFDLRRSALLDSYPAHGSGVTLSTDKISIPFSAVEISVLSRSVFSGSVT